MNRDEQIERLVAREHSDPHSLLGAHAQNGGVVVRAFRPEAESVKVRVEGSEPVELERAHPAGLFEGELEGAELPLRYRLEVSYAEGAKLVVDDPYSFPPTLGELDIYLASEGRHERIYDRLGAHVTEVEGVVGTAFAVWAPSVAVSPPTSDAAPSVPTAAPPDPEPPPPA